MQALKFFKASTQNDLERCYPIMKELRTHISPEEFIVIYKQAHKQDQYEIVAAEDNAGNILAVMGYRILHDYVHGKHLYIDDLVSTKDDRSKGIGAQLLLYAERIAQESNCTGLRLCTGIENELGKKFYERNGWEFRAIVYKKKLKVDKLS